ncbi:MAG TPA: hypothetical protein VN368_00990 [Candidatus Methylomirabilis sp.]|nr:hypothetical protein [Candidatus Methylomirabilis sp.]
MAVKVDIYYHYSGKCGSGTSNSYGYTRTPGGSSSGTTQISCTVPEADREKTLRQYAINFANISPFEEVYVNGVLYQSPTAPPACTPGTTRQVRCPSDPDKIVTQECLNGSWVNIKTDENKCADDYTKIIVIAVIVIAFFIMLRK